MKFNSEFDMIETEGKYVIFSLYNMSKANEFSFNKGVYTDEISILER